MRGKAAKRIRKIVWANNSFRTRTYGIKATGEIIETGRRGFERRLRRGTLLAGMGIFDEAAEAAVAV